MELIRKHSPVPSSKAKGFNQVLTIYKKLRETYSNNGALGTTRTFDPLLRRQLLYPPELRGQRILLYLILFNFQSYLYAISVSYGISAVEFESSLCGLTVSRYSLYPLRFTTTGPVLYPLTWIILYFLPLSPSSRS